MAIGSSKNLLADIAEVCGPDVVVGSGAAEPTRRIVLSSVGQEGNYEVGEVSCNSETVSDPLGAGAYALGAILALTQGWF
ncbi:hypothetical protein SPFM20_00083 [Salmonella phage SPFM20]|nr:hypothetical protein SPFM20_00083 [Salmonella phage SPFM20]